MGENFEKIDGEKESLERDKRSRVLSRFLRSAEHIAPLHGKTVEDVFSNESEKRTFIENLGSNEFFEILDGINGILRGKNKDEWEMDGEWVVLRGILLGTDYFPPLQEDKPQLLLKVLDAAKKMNNEKRGMEDIALLISSGLNAIHPYADANGRTSRFIYLLLTEGIQSKTQSKFSEALGLYGRDRFHTNPGPIEGAICDIVEKEIIPKNNETDTVPITNLFGYKKDIHFGEDIEEKDKDLFSKLLQFDGPNLFLGVFQYLQTQEDRKKYLRVFPKRAAVPVDILSKNITQEGLTQILQNYRNLKNKYIETLIDVIAHPDKEEYQIEYEGERMSLKKYLEQY